MRKLRVGIKLAAMLAFTLVFGGAEIVWAQTTKWVDQSNGNDGNNGNSEAAAYASLQTAINNSQSGSASVRSIIYVKNGTYAAAGLVNPAGAGTAILIQNLNYLTIQAAPNHAPKVQPMTPGMVSVSVANCQHLIVEGIASDQSVAQADNWQVFGSDDLTVRNCAFEGGQRGINFSTTLNRVTVEKSTFKNISLLETSDALEFLQASYSGVTIQDNTFLNNRRHIRLHLQPGNTINNFTIRRNFMNGTSGEESLRLIGAADVVIENNVLMNSVQQGLYVDAGCSNISVRHNSFYKTGFETIRTKLVSPDMAIKNNIFYGDGVHAALAAAISPLPGEDYNLMFNTGSLTETASQPAVVAFGAHSKIGVDPMFANTIAGSEDLHLLNGSPAIGAGVNLSVATDFANEVRPQPAASNPDLGAYESSRATPDNGATSNALKIMPLGDSITSMYTDHDSYRRPLWHLLQGGGFTVDFVGSQNLNKNGPPPHPDFDMDHEGHSGWRTDEILVSLGGWARTYEPDIVLIHLGSNDVFQYQSNAGTITELGRVIDTLRSVNPVVKILLAQIIPSIYEANAIADLNQRIPNLVATKTTPQSPVIVVDQWTGFSVNQDMYDGVHPNDAGDQKMANKWYAALTGLLSTATVKWVDQMNGSNNNDGNSEATAYASLQFALDHSKSGSAAARSVIYVKNGTYGVTGLTNPNSAATAVLVQNLDYLTIQAVPGHSPKIQPATVGTVSLSVVNCDHLIVDGVVSDQSAAQADNWQVFDANDLTVRNCAFEGGQRGINFSATLHTVVVEKSTFRNIALLATSDALEFLQASYNDVTIQDNTFVNNMRHIRLHLQTGNAISDFTIRRNVMSGTSGEESLRLIGASNVVIENNVVMNSVQQGLYIDSGCGNITVRHNSFFKTGFEAIRTRVNTADIVLKNNIFYGNGAYAAVAASLSPLPGEDYNLIFNTGSMTETASQPAVLSFGANTKIGADPLFVSTAAGNENLHLQNASPAITMGMDLGVAEDLERGARPQPVSTKPDVGAYESPLPLLAVPDIAVNSIALEWGEVTLGSNATQTLVVSNTGGAALQVTATILSGANASEFAIASGGAPFTLSPGTSHNLVLRFTPASAGSKSASLSLTSNDTDESPMKVALSGTGRAALSNAYVLLAENKIQIKGQRLSAGDIHSNNELLFDTGDPSTHTGNATSLGKATIKKYNTVNGNVKAGGQLVAENDVTITGTASGYSSVAYVNLPTPSFSAGNQNVTVAKWDKQSLAPGYYRDVKIETDGTLFLQNGEYFFKSLEVKDRAVLAIDVTDGAVTINVVAALTFRNSAKTTISPEGDNSSSLVTFNGQGAVVIEDNAIILGAFITPAKKVTLGKDVFFKGSITARDIIVGDRTTFMYHTSSGAAPKWNADGNQTAEHAEQAAAAMQYELAQNYPNPFNPSTTIQFSIPEGVANGVTLQIFDMRGALVKTLVAGALRAGRHQVVWNGTNKNGEHVASGMYLYRIQAGSFVQTKQMLLVR